MMRFFFLIVLLFISFQVCFSQSNKKSKQHPKFRHKKYIPVSKNAQFNLSNESIKLSVDSSRQIRNEIIKFSANFLGTKYKIAGQDPRGFDCSGFVSYIFENFGIPLYTSASYMYKQGKSIEMKDAREGDIIYFNSTTSKQIGHVGIITSKNGEPIRFIHSSSSKEYCVKYDMLEPNYIKRYFGVKRIVE